MPKLAANLSMMFTEHEFLDLFDAAAEAGFAAVEFLFPYDHPPEAIAERLDRNRLTQALFNLPPAAGTKASGGSPPCPRGSTNSSPASRAHSTMSRRPRLAVYT